MCCHLFHKKLELQSLQIFSTFKFNFIRTLLPSGETLLNRKFNTRVFDFKLIAWCSWLHMILNSYGLPGQSHHNNFRLTLSNLFGECEEIQSKLHNIVPTLLQWVWALSVVSKSFCDFNWLKLDKSYFYSFLIRGTKFIYQCILLLVTEGKIVLLVTFIQWFVTQSKISLMFTETLLFAHKTAYFLNDWQDLWQFKVLYN